MKQNGLELHVHGVCHQCASKIKLKKSNTRLCPQKALISLFTSAVLQNCNYPGQYLFMTFDQVYFSIIKLKQI